MYNIVGNQVEHNDYVVEILYIIEGNIELHIILIL